MNLRQAEIIMEHCAVISHFASLDGAKHVDTGGVYDATEASKDHFEAVAALGSYLADIMIGSKHGVPDGTTEEQDTAARRTLDALMLASKLGVLSEILKAGGCHAEGAVN